MDNETYSTIRDVPCTYLILDSFFPAVKIPQVPQVRLLLFCSYVSSRVKYSLWILEDFQEICYYREVENCSEPYGDWDLIPDWNISLPWYQFSHLYITPRNQNIRCQIFNFCAYVSSSWLVWTVGRILSCFKRFNSVTPSALHDFLCKRNLNACMRLLGLWLLTRCWAGRSYIPLDRSLVFLALEYFQYLST